MSYTRYHHYPESYTNGLASNRTTKTDSPINRSTMNVMPSTFQPGLQRQQSLSYEKNLSNQRLPPESNSSSHRGSSKTTNNSQPIRRAVNENSRLSNQFEQQKRL